MRKTNAKKIYSQHLITVLLICVMVFLGAGVPFLAAAEISSVDISTEETSPTTAPSTAVTTPAASSTSEGPDYETGNQDDQPFVWQPPFEVEHDAYYVFDLERGGTLFEKNSRMKRQGPLAVNTMLALLALENLDNKIALTVSREIAERSKNENILNIELRAGSKYSPEFLLHSVLLYDSKAAARVLAEALAEDMAALADNMNRRARVLGMDNTEFMTTISGELSAYSNLADLARLMQQTVSMSTYNKIFQTKSDIYFQADQQPIYLENRMSYAWTWSNNLIKGSSLARAGLTYTIAYTASGPDYSIMVLQTSTAKSASTNSDLITSAVWEAFDIMEAVFEGYARTVLVTRGAHCTDIVQQDGITVTLVYLDTVYYIRPIGAADFEPALQLSVSEVLPLPIEEGERLGQMIFTLPDQSRYVVNVGSDRDILTHNTTLEKILSTAREYQQIVIIALILAALLIIVGIIKLVSIIIRRIVLSKQDRLRQWRDLH